MLDPEKLKGYIFTLEIAAKELPAHAHPVHRERLRELRDHYKLQLELVDHGRRVIGEFCGRMSTG